MRANVLDADGRHDRPRPRSSDAYDRETRQEGFHALHDWDGAAERVNEDTIPVDVLDYIVGSAAPSRRPGGRWPS